MKQTTKYYIYFEAFKSNWDPSQFYNSDFLSIYLYKKTANNLYFYNFNNNKNESCYYNDIIKETQDEKRGYYATNQRVFEIDKQMYKKAIEFLTCHKVEKRENVTPRYNFYLTIKSIYKYNLL